MKRWLKRLGFGLAALITLGALLLAVENYRGKRAWDRCRQELEAKGEKLDWSALTPPRVADDQNFAKTPLLAGLLTRAMESTNLSPPLTPQWPGQVMGGDWRSGKVADLAGSQARLRDTNISTAGDPDWAALRERTSGTPIEDLRFLLQRREAVLEELRAAVRRPAAQLAGTDFPDVGRLLPQFTVLKSLTLVHRAAALVELESGAPDAALADVQVMLAVGELAGGEPLLIGGLVQIAIGEIALQTVWSGLARHQWQEAQLAALQSRLERMNIVAGWQRFLRGERAYGLALLEGLPAVAIANGGAHRSAYDNEAAAQARALRSMPGGLRRQNEVHMAHLGQFFLERMDAAGPSVRLSANLEAQAAAILQGPTWYQTLARPMIPSLVKATEKAVAEQATVSLTLVACALERHRLAKQSYPETLDLLVPGLLTRLPVDPVNGQPLRYRRDAADRFTLYSLGMNLQDDGGAVIRNKDGRVDWRQGDWVWRSEPQ